MSDWLRHFQLLFCNRTAEGNSVNLDRKQLLYVLFHDCVFDMIGKPRWPPWRLIGWDIFSANAERNSTELDMKQGLIVLPMCVFQADRRTKMAALASDWLWYFRLSATTKQNLTKLDRRRDPNVLYQLNGFFVPIGKSLWAPLPVIGWDISILFSETSKRNLLNLTGSKYIFVLDYANALYQVCV